MSLDEKHDEDDTHKDDEELQEWDDGRDLGEQGVARTPQWQEWDRSCRIATVWRKGNA
jgi:hypothetical protein